MRKRFALVVFLASLLLFWAFLRSQLSKKPAPILINPVDLRIGADISGSMGAQLPEVKRGLLDVANALKVGDRAVMVVFCDVPNTLWAGDIKTDADISAIKADIENLQPSTRAGTDQVGGYQRLLGALPNDGRKFARRYISVCSDSYADMPNGERRQWGQVNFGSLSRDVSLRLFYYDNERDTDFLRLLTGRGVRYRVASADESSAALHDLSAEIGYVHSSQWHEERPGVKPNSTISPATTPLRKRVAATRIALWALPVGVGAVLLLVLVDRAKRARKARVQWEAEKARGASLYAEAPTRDVLRLSIQGQNRLFERELTPLSAFTFGTIDGVDFAFRTPNGAVVDGAVEIGADGMPVLLNRAGNSLWQIGEHQVRPGQRVPIREEMNVCVAPQFILRLRREIAVTGGTVSVDNLVRAAREQRRTARHEGDGVTVGAAGEVGSG